MNTSIRSTFHRDNVYILNCVHAIDVLIQFYSMIHMLSKLIVFGFNVDGNLLQKYVK